MWCVSEDTCISETCPWINCESRTTTHSWRERKRERERVRGQEQYMYVHVVWNWTAVYILHILYIQMYISTAIL